MAMSAMSAAGFSFPSSYDGIRSEGGWAPLEKRQQYHCTVVNAMNDVFN